MIQKKTTEVVKELALPIVESMGCELVDVEYVKEGSNWYLRLFIDKPDGITIDDCEAISRQISILLDEEDPISQQYILEVSSPGLDRPLKNERDFQKAMGKTVEVKLYEPLEGSKVIEGKLVGYDENVIKIEIEEGGNLELTFKKIAIIRKAINF